MTTPLLCVIVFLRRSAGMSVDMYIYMGWSVVLVEKGVSLARLNARILKKICTVSKESPEI